jgi:peptidoglycan/xylan/chitin deacetylase (PgdA/CDA1 family)
LIPALCATLSVSIAATAAVSQRLSFDHAATSQRVVALTFDADMTPGMLAELKKRKIASWYNEKVIATLRQQQVPATLFMTGLWIEAYGDVTRELSADPLFELGNHSYSHGAFHSPCYHLFPIKESNQAAEVQKTDELLRKNTESYKKYFRFPGLCADAAAVKTVEDQGYTVIGGDVDGADAFVNNPKWISSDVVANVHPGSIVVLHMHGGPNAPGTAAALPDIIKRLRADGYTFVKVSDLLQLPPGEPVSPPARPRPVERSPSQTATVPFWSSTFFQQQTSTAPGGITLRCSPSRRCGPR